MESDRGSKSECITGGSRQRGVKTGGVRGISYFVTGRRVYSFPS